MNGIYYAPWKPESTRPSFTTACCAALATNAPIVTSGADVRAADCHVRTRADDRMLRSVTISGNRGFVLAKLVPNAHA